MTDMKREPFRIPGEETGWWYAEFSGPEAGPTKGAPAASVQPGGISAAQSWLNANITPGDDALFGNVDGQGTVRIFYYGTARPHLFPVPEQ